MTSALLCAEAISCRVGGRRVVDGVSLRLQPGDWLALVGPNGAGKSTLLAALAGVAPVSAGQVALDGIALARLGATDRARRIAWLAQGAQVEGEMTVRDIARLGRLPRRGLHAQFDASDEAAITAALREMRIAPLAQRRIGALSGGERQRALIARALAVEADVLLMDEPTAHLDPPHQRTLMRSLRARAAQGCAVVTVLHDLTLALRADRVAVLVEGRLVADGRPADAALHAVLREAFDDALSILELPDADTGCPRWIAVAEH